MSMANRREYLRSPVGRSPVREAINGMIRAMPIGGARSGLLGAAGGVAIPDSVVNDSDRWYVSDEISATDGDTLSSWTDQQGNTNLTQGTASKQPLYKTSIINGEPVVRFDGSDDLLQGTFTAESQPIHIFMLTQKRSGVTNLLEQWIDGSSQNEMAFRSLSDANSNQWDWYAGSGLNGGTEDADVHVITSLFDTTSSVGRIDGAQIASGNAGSNSLSGITVGGHGGGGSYADIDVVELIYFFSKQSTSTRDEIEEYLADKGGVTLA